MGMMDNVGMRAALAAPGGKRFAHTRDCWTAVDFANTLKSNIMSER